MRERDWHGRFICKSDDYRKVKTMRVTDGVWEGFGEMAAQRGITRADLLEEIVKSEDLLLNNDHVINLL